MAAPRRGEVWLADLNPTRGHEQAGRRPVLIVSDDIFNRGLADLVIALPMTTRIRPIPSHIVIEPPEGGVRRESAILCEAIRSLGKGRLVKRWGQATDHTLAAVSDALTILLKL